MRYPPSSNWREKLEEAKEKEAPDDEQRELPGNALFLFTTGNQRVGATNQLNPKDPSDPGVFGSLRQIEIVRWTKGEKAKN